VIWWFVTLLACRDADPPPTTEGSLTAVEARVSENVGSVLVVSWQQTGTAEVSVAFAVDGEPFVHSPVRSLGAGAHEELLLGVPFDDDVTWRIEATNDAGTTTTPEVVTRTGPTPEFLPVAQVLESDPTRWDADARFFLTALNGSGRGYLDPYYTFITDRLGRVVWAVETPDARMTMHPRIAFDGRSMLIDHNSFWAIFDGGAASTIHRVLIDGTEVESWDTPGLHHPFTELPDGSIAYGRSTRGYETETLDLVHPDRTTTSLWDCDAWLEGIPRSGECGSNTLNYDAATDTFLFSFYSLDTVVEIDAQGGLATRWFGNVPGSYAFDPPESQFWWQHGGYWTSAGTFLTSTYVEEDGVETVAREYAVDEATKTLHEVSNFGVGDGIFGSTMGEAHLLSNGNLLHNTGSAQRLREATPDGTVVWDIVWDNVDGEIGRSTPIRDLYDLAPPRR
jgi:hypothetical protein